MSNIISPRNLISYLAYYFCLASAEGSSKHKNDLVAASNSFLLLETPFQARVWGRWGGAGTVRKGSEESRGQQEGTWRRKRCSGCHFLVLVFRLLETREGWEGGSRKG